VWTRTVPVGSKGGSLSVAQIPSFFGARETVYRENFPGKISVASFRIVESYKILKNTGVLAGKSNFPGKLLAIERRTHAVAARLH
jgi:hypothetical protein